jgi:serine protease
MSVVAIWLASFGAPVARAAALGPNKVVVGYALATPHGVSATVASNARAVVSSPTAVQTRALRLPRGMTVAQALARLRREPDVRWAVPDYIAHEADAGTPAPFIPNNPGSAGVPGGWTGLQWNFAGPFGVGAPQAWGNLISEHAAGGHGVTVAVLDTGIAYRNVARRWSSRCSLKPSTTAASTSSNGEEDPRCARSGG